MKFLNKFLFLSVLAMSLTLVSCSDDDKGPGSTEELVGMWEVVEGTEWEKEDGEIVYEDDDYNGDLRYEFKANGTYNRYYKSGSSWYNDENGTYSYKKGTLTMFDEDEEESYSATVKALTATTLEIESYASFNEGGIYYEAYVSFKFKRISSAD